MTRKFKVNIDGKTFIVEVEEILNEIPKKETVKELEKQKDYKEVSLIKDLKEKSELKKEEILCPMPAKVISLKCKPGDVVKKGDILLIIDAMKMEHNIIAPRDGVIIEVKTFEGASVAHNQPLIIMS